MFKHRIPQCWSKRILLSGGAWAKVGSNQKQPVINFVSKKDVRQLQEDGGIFMDANESNNT
jgi:hypothetical protein